VLAPSSAETPSAHYIKAEAEDKIPKRLITTSLHRPEPQPCNYFKSYLIYLIIDILKELIIFYAKFSKSQVMLPLYNESTTNIIQIYTKLIHTY
jgi:hypothetical protein